MTRNQPPVSKAFCLEQFAVVVTATILKKTQFLKVITQRCCACYLVSKQRRRMHFT